METKEARRLAFRKHCVATYPQYAKARAALDSAESKQKEVSDAFDKLKHTLEKSFLAVKKKAEDLPTPEAKADKEKIFHKIKLLEETHRKTVSEIENNLNHPNKWLNIEGIWLQTDENDLIYHGDMNSHQSEKIQRQMGELEGEFKKFFTSIVTTQTNIIGSTEHLALEINQLIAKYLKPYEPLIRQRIDEAVKPFKAELDACYAIIAGLKKELAQQKKDDKPFDRPTVTAFSHSPLNSSHPITGTSSAMFSVSASTGSTSSAASNTTNALRDDLQGSNDSSSTPASPVARPSTPNLQS